MPTVGVEEEFFLLDADGDGAPVAPQVLGDLGQAGRFHAEWVQFQIEAVTGVCTDLSGLAAELSAGRTAVAGAGLARGALMVSSGTPPCRVRRRDTLTEDARFDQLRLRFPAAADGQATCGCHVHVGVPSRELGVEVLNRVRGWLPVLLALSGNSPMRHGEDCGWDSDRHRVFARWPTARVPPRCTDIRAYDGALADQISQGRAIDVGSVYWYARISPRFPTVEFRIADTGLTVADTLLQAALCRALVATALVEAAERRAVHDIPDLVLAESLARAAQHGLGTLLVDPETGVLVPGFTLFHRLVGHVHPALLAAGDSTTVARLMTRRRAQRSGAARQRALRAHLAPRDFVAAMASASLPAVRVPEEVGDGGLEVTA